MREKKREESSEPSPSEQSQSSPPQQFIPAQNWVNPETRSFISKLSFKGYVLAGNSVANMAEGIPLQGDLDFWAASETSYKAALLQMLPYYTHVNMYPSMVEMYNRKGQLPRLNLIYTNLDPDQTVERFDFDYCRCYWTPGTNIEYEDGCQESIKTKIIKQPLNPIKIMRKRILKAIKYGYTFCKCFWTNFPELLQNSQLLLSSADFANTTPFPIRMQDLNLTKFLIKQLPIKLTNIKNISRTIEEITVQFRHIAKFKNVKLPVLIRFQRGKEGHVELIQKYVDCIVMKNPLSDSRYFQIKIGTEFVNCYPEGEYEGTQKQEYQQSSSSQQQYSEHEPQQLQKNMQQNSNPNLNPKQSIKTIIPDSSTPFVIQLNESGTAYISVDYLPKDLYQAGLENFNQMWRLHPEQRHKIILSEKEVQVHRYSKSYLHTPTDLTHTAYSSYMYSGYNTSSNNDPLPEQFQPFYSAIQKKDSRYNQVIANWYQDEQDYIAAHSDCQKGMIENGSVSLVSLYGVDDSGLWRFLEVVPKKNTDSLAGRFVIRLDHGSIITMHGKTQDQFRHEIKKSNKQVPPRISLSFRQMMIK